MSLPRFVARRSEEEILFHYFFFFYEEGRSGGVGSRWREKKRNPAAATWRYANPIVVNCQRYGLCPVSEEELASPSSPLLSLSLLFFLLLAPSRTRSPHRFFLFFFPPPPLWLVAFRAGFTLPLRCGERHLSAKLAWLPPFRRRAMDGGTVLL